MGFKSFFFVWGERRALQGSFCLFCIFFFEKTVPITALVVLTAERWRGWRKIMKMPEKEKHYEKWWLLRMFFTAFLIWTSIFKTQQRYFHQQMLHINRYFSFKPQYNKSAGVLSIKLERDHLFRVQSAEDCKVTPE